MRKLILTVAAALLTTSAQAQLFPDEMQISAMAIDVYQTTATQCNYPAEVVETLGQLDTRFTNSDPYYWDYMRRQMQGSANQLLNLAKVTGSSITPCALYMQAIRPALLIGQIQGQLGQLFSGKAPSADMGTLMNGPGSMDNPNNNPDLCYLRIGGCDDIMDNDPHCHPGECAGSDEDNPPAGEEGELPW